MGVFFGEGRGRAVHGPGAPKKATFRMVAQWNPLNVTTELLIWHGKLTGVNEERVGIYY